MTRDRSSEPPEPALARREPKAESREPPLDAPTRILHATAHLLAERGVARFNLQEVAEAAAVSKGLIHYHYHDRDTLLTRLVEALVADVTRRQQEALAHSTPTTAVEDLWTWLRGELRRGHLRVLQELTQEPGALVRGAVHAAAALRRAATAATLEQLFALLALRPRIPPTLLADVVVAFEDGLVLGAAVQPEQDPRVAFDVFWLGILGLVE
jgi:AcrR family transcriptional regulator